MAVEDTSQPVGSASSADSADNTPVPEARTALHLPRLDAEMVIDYQTLRAVIGAIAVLLVPVVYVANWLIFTRHVGECFVPNVRIPGSLSGFYYTHMRNLFVGAMCAMGVFLVAYRGFGGRDYWFTNVAGLAAIGIGLFPTMPPQYRTSPTGPNQFFSGSNLCGPATLITYRQSPNQRIIGYVHLGLLFVLFLMVFLMVLVQFTRTLDSASRHSGDSAGGILAWWKSVFPDERSNPKKQRRNWVYVLCAGCIAICGLVAIVTAIRPSAMQSGLLYAESFAFVFFGIAWFVKGAASDPPKHGPLRIWPLSWLGRLRRWLADDTHDEPVGPSV
jgi:hypothetical protein